MRKRRNDEITNSSIIDIRIRRKKHSFADRGITLIALIVTIIVMLILAGVTISIAIGDNGIIERAKESGKRYQEAAANETNQLGELDESISTLGEGTSSRGNSTNTNIKLSDTKKYTVKGDKLLDSTGAEITDATAKKNALSEIYGQKVNYTSDSSSNTEINNRTWRIFFIDFDGKYSIDGTKGTIYLKADDTNIDSWDFYEIRTEQSEKLNAIDDISIMKQINPDWWNNRGKKLKISEYDTNEKLIAYLCNKEQYVKYKNNDANWVIGGPSIEMYCDSYNSVNHNSGTNKILGTEYDEGEISGRTIASGGGHGYIVTLDGKRASDSELFGYYQTPGNIIDTEGYNSMYGCNRTWQLSSAGAFYDVGLCVVTSGAGLDLWANGSADLCELVSLKSNTSNLYIE